MNQSAWIRPEWNPATIALMVLGFVIFWPLGLAMLAYILFGDRLHEFKREANATVDRGFDTMRRYTSGKGFSQYTGGTGNAAFDDWRRQELERIENERRKLDEARREFDEYVSELRRAKDQEEFSKFMRDRNARNGNDTNGTTGN
ncbi:hypothetical protein ABID16_004454 [Rhizobium aquaticum]|uniref:DUF2852 domain-containing protein n=1 Tax=Rhizobium aquaticum TaxID=1549636 RepID=A0ABV2J5T2_9HYPH